MIERLALTQNVAGLSPAPLAKYASVLELAIHYALRTHSPEGIGSSNLPRRTKSDDFF